MNKNVCTYVRCQKDFSYMEKSQLKNGYLVTVKNKNNGVCKNAIVGSFDGFGRYLNIIGEEYFLQLSIFRKNLLPKKEETDFVISKVYRPLNNKDFADITNYQLVAVQNKRGLRFVSPKKEVQAK